MAELIYHPEAKDEIREAARFYESRRERLGEEFLVQRPASSVRVSPRRGDGV